MSGPGRLDVRVIHGPAAVAAAATQTATFPAPGEHLGLVITCTGAPGVTPITVQQLLPDAVTWAPVTDRQGAAITFTPTLAAQTVALACEGLVLMPGEQYRLTFTPTAAAGNITITAQMSNRSQTFASFTADLIAAINLATAELVVINNSTGLIATAIGVHDEPTADPGMRILSEVAAVQPVAITAGHDSREVLTTTRGKVGADYDWTDQAGRSKEVDSLDTRGVQDFVIDVTGLAAAGPFYAYLSMQTKQNVSIHTRMNDGSGAEDDLELTIQASNTTGVAPAAIPAGDWGDVTVALTGGATIVNTAGAVNRFDNTEHFSCEWLRFAYRRTAGAANDGDIYVKVKRWY